MAMESAWARFQRVCDYLVVEHALLALRSLFLYCPLALPMVRAGYGTVSAACRAPITVHVALSARCVPERRQIDDPHHACDDLARLERPLSDRHRSALSVSSRVLLCR